MGDFFTDECSATGGYGPSRKPYWLHWLVPNSIEGFREIVQQVISTQLPMHFKAICYNHSPTVVMDDRAYNLSSSS
jgi:hypothetical protein